MTFIALMALHVIVLSALYFAIRKLSPQQQDRLIALARFRGR